MHQQCTYPNYTRNNRFISHLSPLYTRRQGQKILGPTLSIFGLQIGTKLLINAGTLAPRVANWPPKFLGILFFSLGANKGHKVQHLLVLEASERFFSISALTHSVKLFRLISTFAPIEMLDLG
jgi:hypothetical protein